MSAWDLVSTCIKVWTHVYSKHTHTQAGDLSFLTDLPVGVALCSGLLWGRPYLRLKLKTVLSTQLATDIFHIHMLGWKINASRWRNAALPTLTFSADAVTSTHAGSSPVSPRARWDTATVRFHTDTFPTRLSSWRKPAKVRCRCDSWYRGSRYHGVCSVL